MCPRRLAGIRVVLVADLLCPKWKDVFLPLLGPQMASAQPQVPLALGSGWPEGVSASSAV